MTAHPDTSRLLNEEHLEDFILRELGAPQITVQLTQEDLEQAIDQSKRWFSAKKGAKKISAMTISSNVVEYKLAEEIDVVLDVVFPQTASDFSRLLDPLGLLDGAIPYNAFPAPATAGLFSTYVQALQYLEVAKRVTGAELEWMQEDRTLYIFPVPKSSGTIIIHYKANRFTIDQLSERDHDLVKRYALAWAKRKLGRVRSRHDQWPGAQGTSTGDGERLLEEAKEEFLGLEEEISQSAFPMGFVTG